MRILVSTCLLGINCRYNGKRDINPRISRLIGIHELIPFCPEIYGGLMTPREPSERLDNKVVTKSGKDVTSEYETGALETVKVFQMLNCDIAILQDKSPACGVNTIHNGLFDGGLVSGDGVAAEALKNIGAQVYNASDAYIDTL